MFGKFISRNRKNPGHMRSRRAERAQAIVEFAIALPVLLMMLIGIIEVSRMLFMYASVVNSSRDAVRYASAYGKSDIGPNYYLKYKYCAGIRDVAKKSGFFLNLADTNITITYDDGNLPSPASLGSCPVGTVGEASVNVDSEDRVTVTVSKTYNPILKLLPIPTRTFTASSSRTILGIMKLDN